MTDRREEKGWLLWWMLVCFTFLFEVVYRSAFLIGFEVACSVVAVSKQHVSLL